MNNKTKTMKRKYQIWVNIVSVAIPVVVALLFKVRLPNVEPLSFLPPIYASINGLTALLLISALIAINSNKRRLHEGLMKTAIACSLIFLVMYVAYHMTSDPTRYEGPISYIYYSILISHIVLSIIVIPLVLISYVRAYLGDYAAHKKIVKFAYPVWLYVAVTGVIVFLMISPYYV
jgi:putative membrane protein|tara:strand:- start:108 stop:635 length:528 start_codon:yes stop_codon:yes gene_type:complete